MISLSRMFADVQRRPPLTREAYAERRKRDLAEVRADLIRHNARIVAERIRRESGLGDRFASRSFTSWRQAPETAAAFAAAKAAVTGSSGAWFFGAVGCGKTHLAAAIVNAALDASTPAIFTTGVGLLERLRRSYDDKGDVRNGERDIIGQLVTAPVLALDDLGKERFTAWSAEQLWRLVNDRYEAGLPVIVTSNIAPQDLAAHWVRRDIDPSVGESICRRLAEMTGAMYRLGENS